MEFHGCESILHRIDFYHRATESIFRVIHRADYVKVLQDAATLAGAKIRLGAEVVDINFDETSVKLSTGEVIRGDAIIGADGLWSRTRDLILSSPSPPTETGDLAYRGTFTRAQLEPLSDLKVNDLCAERKVTVWMGPNRHAVFYPVKHGQQYNLVLLRPDDLPTDTKSEEGEVDEMRDTFQGWDERLRKLISCLPSALKWKLCHHKELETWIKVRTMSMIEDRSTTLMTVLQGRVVLLGDACHPSLPYQAQGAAMAVEDGAVLGKLLSKASELDGANMESFVPKVLRLYESLRKSRTTVNVVGAVANRYWYHLPDGPEQEERDAFLRKEIWSDKVNWNLLDADYQYNLLGVDVVKDCEEAFEVWVRSCDS